MMNSFLQARYFLKVLSGVTTVKQRYQRGIHNKSKHSVHWHDFQTKHQHFLWASFVLLRPVCSRCDDKHQAAIYGKGSYRLTGQMQDAALLGDKNKTKHVGHSHQRTSLFHKDQKQNLKCPKNQWPLIRDDLQQK